MNTVKFLGITTPFYLVILLFLCGASTFNGLQHFLMGLMCFGLAGLAFLRGRRRPLYFLYFSCLMMASLVGLVELTLRLAPGILKGEIALAAYGGYHTDTGGIYDLDPTMGYRLRKNVSERIYSNGHWWTHETNSEGYRGPLIEHPEVVFLGDSMIYGHGVENSDTVASRFAQHSGLKTVNLGQQGTSLLQMWIRYREMSSPDRQPRYVFVCSHWNDILDASHHYSLEELERFIAATSKGEDSHPKAKMVRQSNSFIDCCKRFWNRKIQLNLRVAGVFRYALQKLKSGQETNDSAEMIATEQFIPCETMRTRSFAPWKTIATRAEQLGWQTHVAALKRLKQLCEQQRATLVMFDLGYSRDFCRAIELLAQELEVPYVRAGEIALTRALAGEEVYLKNDGHWTGLGADIVAQELFKAIRN